MKRPFSKNYLKTIIKEEVNNILFEKNIKDKILSKLPDILNNDVAKKIFDVAVGGVRDKKISISDLIDVSKGLNTAVRTGNKEFAEKAVANNNALKKLGLDVVIGDISDSYDDPTRLAGKPIERFAGKKKKFSPVYGAKVVLSL